MAEARGRDEWGRTSSLMALIANMLRDPKRARALKPKDFDPFAKRSKPIKADISVLKDVFIDGKWPEQAR